MDTEFWFMLIKIIIFLPLILCLIYLFIKYGGNKLQNIQSGKYIKVIERVSLSKENNLLVLKIGKKGYVLSSTHGKVEIMMELSEDELLKVESNNSIKEYKNIKEVIEKLKSKKEDNDNNE